MAQLERISKFILDDGRNYKYSLSRCTIELKTSPYCKSVSNSTLTLFREVYPHGSCVWENRTSGKNLSLFGREKYSETFPTTLIRGLSCFSFKKSRALSA